MNNNYYVYELHDPLNNFQPFYVGKGKDYRVKHHYSPKYVEKNSHKSNIIKRYRKAGFKDDYVFVASRLTEEESFYIERKLIEVAGFRKSGGLLVNISFGGEGSSGCNQPKSPEHRKAISEALKGKTVSKEARLNMSKVRKGIPLKEETKRKVSEALKGRRHSKDHNDAVSKALKGRKISEEHKAIAIKNLRNDTGCRWYEITDPEGKAFKVYNLAKFCREKGLSKAHLGQVALGTRKHHKKYKARFLNDI